MDHNVEKVRNEEVTGPLEMEIGTCHPNVTIACQFYSFKEIIGKEFEKSSKGVLNLFEIGSKRVRGKGSRKALKRVWEVFSKRIRK